MYKLIVLFVSLMCVAAQNSSDQSNTTQFVSYRLYGKSFSKYSDIPSSDPGALLDHPNFNKNQSVVFYIHGYKEQATDLTQREVISAYLKKGDVNIILVNWSELAGGNYFLSAMRNVARVGILLADSIKTLVDNGLNIANVHLVGHCLGAHVTSNTALKLQDYRLQLPRITGLDPAGPGFYVLGPQSLRQGDANFVDCVHTDGGIYGTLFNRCDVDFWANTGRRIQPGCPTFVIPYQQTEAEFCSHRRSVFLWADAITDNMSFQALQCSTYVFYRTGFCNSNPKVYWSPAMGANARGTYYFSTKSASPYGKGSESSVHPDSNV